MKVFNSVSLLHTHFHVRHHFVKQPHVANYCTVMKCDGILAGGVNFYYHNTNIRLDVMAQHHKVGGIIAGATLLFVHSQKTDLTMTGILHPFTSNCIICKIQRRAFKKVKTMKGSTDVNKSYI